jgi:ubiquinone/menaquinone biosynthesis C-methylase UbiE
MKNFVIILLIILAACNRNLTNKKCDCINYSKMDTTLAKVQNTIINANQFKANENVLSVGAGNGWREFEYALVFDSVNFFLEDINLYCLSQQNLDVSIAKYAQIKGTKLSCNFIPVKGTEKTIENTDNAFDRVLVSFAWHEMTYYHEMMKECNRVLKNNGMLCVSEFWKNGTIGCPFVSHKRLTESEFIEEIESCGFKNTGVLNADETIESSYKVFSFIKK